MKLFSILLACLLSLAVCVNGHAIDMEEAFKLDSCPGLISSFAKKYSKIKVDSHAKDAFVFFLHVPRTAGKTYSTCFLGPSFKPSERCMPGYDYFRYPNSQEGCRYMVSHDDLSVLDVRSVTSSGQNRDALDGMHCVDPVPNVLMLLVCAAEFLKRQHCCGDAASGSYSEGD